MSVQARISQERAQVLLTQCKWLLITSCACLGALVVILKLYGDSFPNAAALCLWLIWLASLIGYIIWLGRLAHGLGRSVIIWVGVSWLANAVFPLGAYIVAYFNIKRAVRVTFAGTDSPAAAHHGTPD